MAFLRRKKDDGPEYPGTRPGTSLVASAALVSQQALRRIQRGGGWQTEAWSYYDSCSTLKVGVNWLGAAASRATLFIAEDDPAQVDEPTQVEDAQAEDILSQLSDARGNAKMLRQLGVHLSVPGESYLTGYDDPATERRKWLPMSADDLRMNGTELMLDQGDGVRLTLKQGQFQIVRIWRPHPRYSAQADSPVRSLGADLAELTGLTQHVLATIDSRLAGNGILAVPESITAPPVTGDKLHDDPVMAALIEAMTVPIQDRDNASAVVPLLLRVPDIAAGKLQHIKFGTDFDARIPEMRQEAIGRIAQGIELPTGIVSGLESANHWTGWLLEESAVKLYVNPLVALICDGLTAGYLRPALRAINHPKAESLLVWYDTSALVLRPDRSKESIELKDRGLISDESTRQANGFSEADRPTPDELARYYVMQLIKAVPDLAPTLLRQLGVAIPNLPPAQPQAPTNPVVVNPNAPAVPGQQQRPAPPTSGPQTPGAPSSPSPGPVGRSRSIPGQRPGGGAPGPAAAAKIPRAAILAYAELGVLRALEVAGSRLLTSGGRSTRGQFSQMDRWQIHTRILGTDPDRLLADAFTVLERVLPDAPCVWRVCHDYARELIEKQTPYEKKTLTDALAVCLDGPETPE